MARNWKFLGRKRENDSQYLHEDYQPQTPQSRINLEQRFGLAIDNQSENQYENWRRYDQLTNPSIWPPAGDKIYENQKEMQDNICSLQRSKSIPNRPPPLPPRNNTPSRHHNTTLMITSQHNNTIMRTPSRNHNTTTVMKTPAGNQHNTTTININASTNIGSHNQTLNGGMFNSGMEIEPQDPVEDACDTLTLYNPSTVNLNGHHQGKYHSRSYSALSRLSVNPPCTFNQTFAAGDGNIYSNLHDEEDEDCDDGNGLGIFIESLQGSVKDSKPNFFKKMSSQKLSQAVQGCRTAIASISQKFRSTTQRRYKLDNNSPRSHSYGTPPPGSIRRTPGKLYSPFNCATPPPPRTHEAKRLQHRPSRLYAGQENRLPRTPRSIQHNSVAFTEPCTVPHVLPPHNRLGPVTRQNAALHHNSGMMEVEEEEVRALTDVYCGARFTSLNNTGPSGIHKQPQQTRLNRSHWGSFHQKSVHHAGRQVQIATTPTHKQDLRRRSVAAGVLEAVGAGSNVVAPPVPPVRKHAPAPIDPSAFQRHLVEFDQMSRNIRVSLGRNSKFRSSVR